MDQRAKDRQEELEWLDHCLRIIRSNIIRYEQEFELKHAQVQELFRSIQGGNEELYSQMMTAASLEEHAKNSLRKNRAALEKPYFGRIDYTEKKKEKEERIYIGKNGVFRNRTDVLIADWRAPISGVYYENELGKGSYGLPDEKPIPIDLHLKRTYDIDGGKLNGFYDSDVASNDQLLVQYLSRNKDAVLGEIIATIQKEQDAIIRETPFANLIVQGVAGSGKTTVAMHRISYLLYNYKERFESNEFCIVGSNDLLLNYITSGLPELDVPNIKHLRMDQLFARLCEKDWGAKCRFAESDDTAFLRCTLRYFQELELFLMYKREAAVDCSALNDDEIGTILSAANNQTLLRENPAFSINRLLSTLDDRVKTRIRFLMSGREKEEIQAKLKQYHGHYKAMRPKQNALQLYGEFFASWTKRQASAGAGGSVTSERLAAHQQRLARREYDLYDMAALALIHYRVGQMKPNEEFGLLFLDEAQDFGIGAYYVLKTLLPAAYFTIMGDVSQNINYETGMNDWYELQKLFLTGPRDRFLLLQKSYRNTIEISEYAGKILERASSGRYKITPVIRHGLPVQENHFRGEAELVEYTASLMEENRKKGFLTSAVICPSETDADRVRALLSADLSVNEKGSQDFSAGLSVLPIRLVKGLEFDTVILWNPDLKAMLSRPDQAKLLYVAATRALHELHVLTC